VFGDNNRQKKVGKRKKKVRRIAVVDLEGGSRRSRGCKAEGGGW
jgi:hypothetical protein